jgi:hypothetical protein
MPVYRIHRLKPNPRQQFRWAPHTIGTTGVKPRDYEGAGVVEAPGAYAAWTALRGTDQALEVGDLLEAEDGALSIFKYVGFEEARWVFPEPPAVPGLVVMAQPSA